MTTVFLSGSRKVSKLSVAVMRRLDNVISCEFDVVTGDANGADKAMQRYLADQEYSRVTIYFVGDSPRNNVGMWHQERVNVPPGARGRDFYAQKDRFMASLADFGLVVWDGKSPGSVQNMLWLIEFGKKGLVFHNPTKNFIKIRERSDIRNVLRLSKASDLKEIDRKIGLPDDLRISHESQSAFDL